VFEGFQLEVVNVGEVALRVRHGGAGTPVVLLHGHPRTHVTWHKVAPLLAVQHTVVCPDLRGYGQSSKPATTDDHEPYSKRAMARDVVALMRYLGHERFAVVGHDRGSYVALRAALDRPETVTQLVFMGAVPILEALERADARFASAWWHWFFFGQTSKAADDWISRDPDAWYTATPEHMGEEAFEDLRKAIHNPETVRAMVEDYRAGLGIDRSHDEADRRAGRRVECPTLVLWARRDDAEELYGDLRPIWAAWADDLQVRSVDSGHHMSEEAPEALASELLQFLR
jgi:haloacetate dehalogenase